MSIKLTQLFKKVCIIITLCILNTACTLPKLTSSNAGNAFVNAREDRLLCQQKWHIQKNISLNLSQTKLKFDSNYNLLRGWGAIETLAEYGGDNGIQALANEKIFKLADRISNPTIGAIIKTCSSIRLALLSDHPDQVIIKNTANLLSMAGSDSVNSIMVALPEIAYHSASKLFRPIEEVAESLLLNPQVSGFERIIIASWLHRISINRRELNRAQKMSSLGLRIAKNDKALYQEYTARFFVTKAYSSYKLTNTQENRYQWAKEMQKEWLTYRREVLPASYDITISHILNSLMGRIIHEFNLKAMSKNDPRFLPNPILKKDFITLIKYETTYAPIMGNNSSHRVSREVYNQSAYLSHITDSENMMNIAINDPNNYDQTMIDYINLKDPISIINLERKRRLITSTVDWRSRLNSRYSADRALVQIHAVNRIKPSSKLRNIEMALKLIQTETHNGAALSVVRAQLLKSNLSETNKQRALTYIERQLNFSANLRILVKSAPPSSVSLTDSIQFLDRTQRFYMSNTYDLETLYNNGVGSDLKRMDTNLDPGSVQLSTMQSRLDNDTVVIVAYPTFSHTTIIAFSNNQVIQHFSPLSEKDIGKLVTIVRQSIDDYRLNIKSNLKVPLQELNILHNHTLKPISSLIKNNKHIIWVGFNALGAIPPPILHDGKNYSIKKNSFSVLSSLEEVMNLKISRTELLPKLTKMLGVGGVSLSTSDIENPRTSTQSTDGFKISQSSAIKLERMPEFIKSIYKAFGSKGNLLLGKNSATETAFKNTLTDQNLLIFGTHGLLAYEGNEASTEPYLLLAQDKISDGRLHASEAAELPLSNVDLVVLAACNTAGTDGKPTSESLSGLTRSFRAAGAKKIIASHWTILEETTADVLQKTLIEVSKGNEIADSLRKIMLKSIKHKNKKFRHPAYWGPYVLVDG